MGNGNAVSSWRPLAYTSDHLEEMIEMTQEYYGVENDIAQRLFIEHEYFKNPSGNALIDLAWDEEKKVIAGQYVVLPMRFKVGKEQIGCVLSLNTLTREAYRGQGIFTKLAENVYARAKEMDKEFCYGMPNQNSYPGFIKKLDFCNLGAIPLFLRPLRLSAMVREFLKNKLLSVIAKPFDRLTAVTKNAISSNIQIIPVTAENAALMDRFWEHAQNKYSIMNVRDQAYVSYRYLSMPLRDYYPFLALQDGVPVAFSAIRIMEVSGMQCGMLADFLFAPGAKAAAEQLLISMMVKAEELNASMVGALMLAHTEEAKLLRRKGFFRCPKKLEPQPFPLIVRAFHEKLKGSGLLQIGHWFFTMGDYDVI